MSDSTTLLLRETGIARLDDGSEAVNVGPIVAALGFLTEGRGEDRGIDEAGAPLPDLLSLAFDVVKSIIQGGRQAEYFRQVKLDFDSQSEGGGHISVALAKQASALRRSTPNAALAKAGLELKGRLQKLDEAAKQLLLELEVLGGGKTRATAKRRKTKTKTKSGSKSRAKAPKAKKKTSKRR